MGGREGWGIPTAQVNSTLRYVLLSSLCFHVYLTEGSIRELLAGTALGIVGAKGLAAPGELVQVTGVTQIYIRNNVQT